MRHLNSIKNFQIHPLWLKLEELSSRYWQKAEQSPYLVWWLLGLIIWTSFSSFIWSIHQYTAMQSRMAIPKMRPTSSPLLTLGNEYLIGKPLPQMQEGMQIEPLFLEGILYDENPEKRQVLIRHAGGKVQTYHIGDIFNSGAKILDIHDLSVDIEQANGSIQRLKLNQYPNQFISNQPLDVSHSSIFNH